MPDDTLVLEWSVMWECKDMCKFVDDLRKQLGVDDSKVVEGYRPGFWTVMDRYRQGGGCKVLATGA